MTGSSDGILRLFRGYEDPDQISLVTAFRGLSDLVPSNRNAGLVFDWQQGQGKALVAGDTRVIKVWNAATEMCTAEFPARSGSCVTSLTGDQVAGDIFVAGFGDGAVRVFDQRLSARSACVRVWREHKQWIVGVHMQRGGMRELVSGARNGEVRLWDLRWEQSFSAIDIANSQSATVKSDGGKNGVSTAGRPTNTTTATKTQDPIVNEGSRSQSHHHNLHLNNNSATTKRMTTTTMRSLSVHEHAPVFAVGTDRHEVRTYNMTGDFLGYYQLGSASGGSGVVGGGTAGAGPTGGGGGIGNTKFNIPVVATAYHPHRMLLATAGLRDGHVTLLGI